MANETKPTTPPAPSAADQIANPTAGPPDLDPSRSDEVAAGMTAKDRARARGPAQIPDAAKPPGDAQAPPPQQVVLDPAVLATAIVAAQTAAASRGAQLLPTEGLDKTVPHGQYKVDGQWVNAHGKPLQTDRKGNPVPSDAEGRPLPKGDDKE